MAREIDDAAEENRDADQKFGDVLAPSGIGVEEEADRERGDGEREPVLGFCGRKFKNQERPGREEKKDREGPS